MYIKIKSMRFLHQAISIDCNQLGSFKTFIHYLAIQMQNKNFVFGFVKIFNKLLIHVHNKQLVDINLYMVYRN